MEVSLLERTLTELQQKLYGEHVLFFHIAAHCLGRGRVQPGLLHQPFEEIHLTDFDHVVLKACRALRHWPREAA